MGEVAGVDDSEEVGRGEEVPAYEEAIGAVYGLDARGGGEECDVEGVGGTPSDGEEDDGGAGGGGSDRAGGVVRVSAEEVWKVAVMWARLNPKESQWGVAEDGKCDFLITAVIQALGWDDGWKQWTRVDLHNILYRRLYPIHAQGGGTR